MKYVEEKLSELKKVLSPEEYKWLENNIINSDQFKESLKLEALVKELNIQIGDYVEIVLPDYPVSEKRMNQMVGQKGVVIDLNHTTYSYYFSVWFENEEARKLHKEGGGIFFHPTYVCKLKDNPDLYNTYLEEKKRIENETKYRWGTCQVCQGPLDMYYQKWCPHCEKPELVTNPNGQKALVLLKAMKYTETHLGIDNLHDDFWDYLIETYPELRNDTYIHIDLKDEKAPDFAQKYLSFIQKEWNLADRTMVWVSW